MKICWDNLELLQLTEAGKFYNGKTYFIFKENCKQCGEDFLGSKVQEYCSLNCSGKHSFGKYQKENPGFQDGEKNPIWNGGSWKYSKDAEWDILRKSPEHIEWREAVFARDNYTCQACSARGSKNGNRLTLNPHHIKKKSEYPELMFVVDNGITLCTPCHIVTFGREEQCASLFQLTLDATKFLGELNGSKT